MSPATEGLTKGLTQDVQKDSQKGSHRTHKGRTKKDSQRLSAKNAVFILVLQGCPRKVLFYIDLTRVVREQWCLTLVLEGLSAKSGVLHSFK